MGSSREAWWSRHFVRAGLEGARFPDIAFVRDAEEIVISWRPPKPSTEAPQMLHPSGTFSVSWDAAYGALAALSSRVAGWLREAQTPGTFDWTASDDPLGTGAPELDQAIAYYTGRTVENLQPLFQAENVSDLMRRLHLNGGNDPAASPECQMLRACRR